MTNRELVVRRTKKGLKLAKMTQQFLLEQFAPACVVINADGEILYRQGPTEKYLEPPAGEPGETILRLAHPGLRLDLQVALQEVMQTEQAIIRRTMMLALPDGLQQINVTIHPWAEVKTDSALFLVVFEAIGASLDGAHPSPQAPNHTADHLTKSLRGELATTQNDLRDTIGELETANEELRLTNQELLTVNEELRSANENLESAHLAVRSMNKEMMLINLELNQKIKELAQVNSDINNLLINTETPTLILTRDFHIKYFTPSAAEIFHITPADVGQPLEHVAHVLQYATLLPDVAQVFATLRPKEIEVQTTHGEWYMMRILPYQTEAHVIDGVILIFVSIMVIRQTTTILEQQYRQLTLLYHMIATFSRTGDIQIIYDAALDGLLGALSADKASILTLDDERVMRFRAWRGLSPEYRQLAEGHSPWSPDEPDPRPVVVPDVQTDPAWADWRGLFHQEGIRALGFIPLQFQGRLMGKFMLYYAYPRSLAPEEIQLAQTIATHVAFVLERARSRATLLAYARQQSIIAELGQQAFQYTQDLSQFMQMVVQQVTQTLQVSHVKVLELQPGGQTLLLRAGVGWREGLVGQAVIAAALDSQAGYTLHLGQPVIVTDLRQETRFHGPPLLLEHQIISGLSVVIAGEQKPFGVLGAHTTEYRLFTEEDVHFLQSIAHILGMAIQRHKDEEALRIANDNLEAQVKKRTSQLSEAQRLAQLGGWEMDIKTGEVIWTEELYHIYGVEPEHFEPTYEKVIAFIHPDDQAGTRERFPTFVAGHAPYESRIRIIRPNGEIRYLHNRNSMIWDEAGNPVRLYGTCQDETERHLAEAQIVHKAEQLAALNEMGQIVVSSLELKTVLNRILERLRLLLRAEGIFILLRAGEQTFRFAAVNGQGFERLTDLEVPVDAGIAGEVMRTNRSVLVQGPEAVAQRVYPHIREITDQPIGVLLAAPLHLKMELIGVLEAIHSQEDVLSQDSLAMLEAAAAWTSIAIGNARLYEEIHRNEERLRELTDQLVAAQEEERRRISRELHDEAGQSLTVLKLNLAMMASDLKESPLSEQLRVAGGLVAETMQRLRLLAYDLRPPEIEIIGLSDTLRDLCENFSQRTRLVIHYSGDPITATLSDAIHLSFYRCLQEALTNVVKHAQATEVQVELEQNASGIHLSIWDNGQGFDPSQPLSQGLGLLGMKERFERLGGSLSITSQMHQGTTLKASVTF